MWIPLAVVVSALAVGVGGWAAWRTVRDQPVILRQLVAAGVVEALIVVEGLVAVVLVATGSAPSDGVTFWGYLLTALLILPVAAAWAFAERTRWSSVVLLVAALTVAFLHYRLVEIWTGS